MPRVPAVLPVLPARRRNSWWRSGIACSSIPNQTDLSPQAQATLDRQAQWLQQYNRYTFTIEGHADERGTREYNIALGARRAQNVRDYLVSRGIDAARMRTISLRQGTAGGGVQRHLVLVSEPPRCDGAQYRRRVLIQPVTCADAGLPRGRHFALSGAVGGAGGHTLDLFAALW